jgi:SnoaL-like domain
MHDVELVRWKIGPLERSRRGLDERIALAAPWLSRRVSMLAGRQAAGSRLRRSLLTRAVRVATAANNRRDYESMLANFHAEVELIPPSKGESMLGFDPVYRGHEGVRRFFEQWKSGFGRHTYEAREIADAGGDRFAIRFGLSGTVGETETEVQEEYANVNTLEAGLLIRQENFYEWRDALDALAEAHGPRFRRGRLVSQRTTPGSIAGSAHSHPRSSREKTHDSWLISV